jgi:hypothetical protein
MTAIEFSPTTDEVDFGVCSSPLGPTPDHPQPPDGGTRSESGDSTPLDAGNGEGARLLGAGSGWASF